MYKKLITMTLAGLALNACLLTDEFSWQPLGAIHGSHAIQQIDAAGINAGILGFTLASNNSKYNAFTFRGDGLSDYTGFQTLGWAIRAKTGVEMDKYYTQSSVDQCVSNILSIGTLTYSAMYSRLLDAQLKGSNASYETAEVQPVTAQIAADSCDLQETKKIIHLSDSVNL